MTNYRIHESKICVRGHRDTHVFDILSPFFRHAFDAWLLCAGKLRFRLIVVSQTNIPSSSTAHKEGRKNEQGSHDRRKIRTIRLVRCKYCNLCVCRPHVGSGPFRRHRNSSNRCPIVSSYLSSKWPGLVPAVLFWNELKV